MFCYKCKLDKSVEEFSLSKRMWDKRGRQSYCRKCMSEYSKIFQKRSDHYKVELVIIEIKVLQ